MTLAENIECVEKALDYIATTDDIDTFDEQRDCVIPLYRLLNKLYAKEKNLDERATNSTGS